jgi:hypothetical protein
MPTTADITAEARAIVTGFEQRDISDPWFAAEALMFTAAWLIGELSRSETDRAAHIANLHQILEGCARARFQQTHQHLRN